MIKYLIAINVVAFVMYGIDKFRSIKKLYRISEKNLLCLGLLGGFGGSILGMFVFHHKTRKFKFYFWNIVYFVIWGIVYFKFLR